MVSYGDRVDCGSILRFQKGACNFQIALKISVFKYVVKERICLCGYQVIRIKRFVRIDNMLYSRSYTVYYPESDRDELEMMRLRVLTVVLVL